MFKENKYYNRYIAIVQRAKEREINSPLFGYTEHHHIIPKSLGGNNDQSNLVILTAKEHFVCHHLLIKITIGLHKRKMIKALASMSMHSKNHKQRHKMTSRMYQLIAKEQQEVKQQKFKEILDWSNNKGHLPNRRSSNDKEKEYSTFVRMVSDTTGTSFDNNMKIEFGKIKNCLEFRQLREYEKAIAWCQTYGFRPSGISTNKQERRAYEIIKTICNSPANIFTQEMRELLQSFPTQDSYKKEQNYIEAMNWCEIARYLPNSVSKNEKELKISHFIYDVCDKNSLTYDVNMAKFFSKFPTMRKFNKIVKFNNLKSWCITHRHLPRSSSNDIIEKQWAMFYQTLRTKSHGGYNEEMTSTLSIFPSYQIYVKLNNKRNM